MAGSVRPKLWTPRIWKDEGLHALWIGHSTVLLKIDGFTVLTDPVFGKRCGVRVGPVTVGLRRLAAPALRVSDLPHIDLIVLSHAHMDHFDIASLRALEHPYTHVVTARRTSDLLRVDRYATVRELGWGDRTRVGPVELTGLRVRHWGARMRTDTFRGYNGYLLETSKRRIVFGGDTAMTSDFRAARAARPMDLAIMPIGAYNPWIHAHCTPEQARQMGDDAGAERFLPVHHQTFQLSREPLLEPIERFLGSAGEDRVVTRAIGDQATIS